MLKIRLMMEDVVRVEFGADDLVAIRALADSRDRAGDDGERAVFAAFLSAVAEVRGLSPAKAHRLMGRRLVTPVLEAFPALTEAQPTAMSVILNIGQLLTKVVDALLPRVDVSALDVELLEHETLRLRFSGPAEMASLVEGVAIGLSAHFGERIEAVHFVPTEALPESRVVQIRITTERRGIERRDGRADRRNPGRDRRKPRDP
jgi:hypothetical protein